LPEVAISVALLTTAVLCLWLAIGRRVLLGWYLQEIRQLEIPENPGDKIVTYPLA
jgi:hypothetical protein